MEHLALTGEQFWKETEDYLGSSPVGEALSFFQGLSADAKYFEWLRTELGLSGKEPTRDVNKYTLEMDAAGLPADLGRQNALRGVSMAMLKKKMRDIALAQEWREWDVVKLCHVPLVMNNQAGAATTQAGDEAGAAAARADEACPEHSHALFMIDFHIRAAALHGLLALHYRRGSPVPSWLLSLSKKITAEYIGTLERSDALAKAYSIASALQEGAQKLSWVDIVLQVMCEGPSFGEALQARVFQICPEYATAVNNWQHMGAIIARFSLRCIEFIDRELGAIGLGGHQLPQGWFREKFMLQAPAQKIAVKRPVAMRGGGECLSEQEQFFNVARIMGQVRKVVEEHGLDLTLTMIGRLVPETDRKGYTTISKKFCVGMNTPSVQSILDINEVLPRFMVGEFDDRVRNTSDPVVGGRFWPWVKEAQGLKEKQRKAEQMAATEAAAAAAAAEAAKLQQEIAEAAGRAATDEQQQLLATLDKQRKAYRLQLQVFVAKHTQGTEKLLERAEEVWVTNENERHRRIEMEMARSTQTCSVVPFDEASVFGATWLMHKPVSAGALVIFDLAQIADETSVIRQNVSQALDTIGSAGAVLVLGTTPPAKMCECLNREAGVFDGVASSSDLSMLRCFLSLQDKSEVGWVTAIFKKPVEADNESVPEGGLPQLLSGSPAFTTGCCLSVPATESVVRDRHGHYIAHARGSQFYVHLLKQLDLVEPLSGGAVLRKDIFIVEFEAHIGELADVLLKAHRDPASAATADVPIWAGQVRKVGPTWRIRLQRVHDLIDQDAHGMAARALKRYKSDTTDRLGELAATVVEPLPVPDGLVNVLQESCTQPLELSQQPRMHVTADGYLDKSRAIIPEQKAGIVATTRPFYEHAPAKLALTKAWRGPSHQPTHLVLIKGGVASIYEDDL